jgi:hypothetical protein
MLTYKRMLLTYAGGHASGRLRREGGRWRWYAAQRMRSVCAACAQRMLTYAGVCFLTCCGRLGREEGGGGKDVGA